MVKHVSLAKATLGRENIADICLQKEDAGELVLEQRFHHGVLIQCSLHGLASVEDEVSDAIGQAFLTRDSSSEELLKIVSERELVPGHQKAWPKEQSASESQK